MDDLGVVRYSVCHLRLEFQFGILVVTEKIPLGVIADAGTEKYDVCHVSGYGVCSGNRVIGNDILCTVSQFVELDTVDVQFSQEEMKSSVLLRLTKTVKCSIF